MRRQLPRQGYDEGAFGDLHRPGQRSHLCAGGDFACQELCFNMEWVTLRNVTELAE